METPAVVNVSDIVDDSTLGLFQAGIFVLCFVCLIMDGFDVQSIGYVAPEIIREWHIPSSLLGPVFSAAPFGVLIGSLLFSILADKIGRRPVLIGLTLYFSVATLLTARASSVNQLLAIRLIAGIGLGGIMPNAVAMAAEYSPRRMRETMIMIVSNGFTAGAAVGGFISAWLIPAFGWRFVFYFGGAVPLVIAVSMLFLLPESLQFMIRWRTNGWHAFHFNWTCRTARSRRWAITGAWTVHAHSFVHSLRRNGSSLFHVVGASWILSH